MLHKIIMPQGGQDIETGTVVRWHVARGAPVRRGDLVCEVETEKAVFEVQAPEDGYLVKIDAPEGSTVPILSAIGWIGTQAADESAPNVGDAGTDRVAPSATTRQALPPAEGDEASGGKTGRGLITPRAKKIAVEMGVDWKDIRGTGPHGRIMEKDVLELARQVESKLPVSATKAKDRQGGELLLMSKVSKVTARKMQQSNREVPHFYLRLVVDMTNALRLREELNHGREKEEQLSVNDLIVKACALALAQTPEMNRSVADEEHWIQWRDVNIGIATATDAGLVVPVLERADEVPLSRLGQETRKLADYARRGKQTNLAQGRLTVSNLGMFGIDDFAAIINPPESAILAVGRIQKKVLVLDDDTTAVRPMMSLILSVDHRVADGALAARFVNSVKELLEGARGLLLQGDVVSTLRSTTPE